MPTLLNVVADADLGRARILELPRGLAFHPLVTALIARFERLRGDGLVADSDPTASARALLSLVHSAVFFEMMMSRDRSARRRGSQVGALLGVLWEGLAPRGRPGARSKSRGRSKV